MSVTTIKQNILYGLGEGSSVSNDTYLAYSLRWANRAYREIFLKAGYKFNFINKRTLLKTIAGQQTYQAPSDFIGFVTIKDETNDTVIDQITPSEFSRDVAGVSITYEEFTSSFDTAVALDNTGILQYSEKVYTGTTEYTRGTDYTIACAAGTITVLSTGGMLDATDYSVDYIHWNNGTPDKFCFEYDKTNSRHIFRFDPIPDDVYTVSLVYPHNPSDLGSHEAIWPYMEHAIECGGIYYGSLEIIEDGQKRAEFKQIYMDAVSDLVKTDQDMIPKNHRIPVVMKRSDYTDRSI